MRDIAYQNKDITSKLLAESLQGKPLSAFGLPELRIVEILPTNLPAVESNELRLDTEAVYEKVRARVEHNQDLTDEELLELMVYPLSIKGNAGKQQGILAAVELAKRLPRQSQALHALAGILTFSDKVIDREYKKKIEEEMKMTQIGQMLIDEGIVMGRSEGRLEGIQAMILENLEEKTPEKQIVGKLQRHFSLTQEDAGRYVREFITGQRS